MLELNSEIGFNSTELDLYIENELYARLGTDIELGDSLQSDDDPRLDSMHSNEREFSKFLLSKDLVVFLEPEILNLNHIPDFFVCNLKRFELDTSYVGRFLELTLLKASDLDSQSPYGRKKFARKRRQKAAFESLNIPVSYICREEQECIKQYQQNHYEGINNLF